MERIPQRTSVLTQTIEILRERVSTGVWGEYLPSEFELAQRLQVGRNTIRKALRQLTMEGLVEPGRSGKRRRILYPDDQAAPPAATDLPVIFLTPYAADRLPAIALRHVDEIRPLLNEVGFRLTLLTSKAFRLKQPEAVLKKLVAEHPASAWILHQTTDPMQRAFRDLRIPTVILGMPHHGIHLPSVTPDLEATARHAASNLIAKGHRRICFLRAHHGLAGSEEALKGFESAFARVVDDDSYAAMVEATPPEADHVNRLLHRLFRLKHPPTAIIVEQIAIVPTVITVLAQLDRKVPDDVSLISLFHDAHLDYLVPTIAHYIINGHLEVKKLVQALIHSIHHGPQHSEPIKLMPEFVTGKSVTQLTDE